MKHNSPNNKPIAMKKVILLVIVCLTVYWLADNNPELLRQTFDQSSPLPANEVLQNAYDNKLSNLQVSGAGYVTRMLRDDLDGSRHQKFILQLSSGQKILVVHNIDLARRINSLALGDEVEFNGEYEWNAKGGLVHWTHHDPAGRHIDGWLKHKGKTYQ